MNMDWAAWFSLGVVLLCFILLARGRLAPDLVLSGGLTLLLVAGILTPAEALAGLANEGMVTVGVLYIVVSGVRETGGIAWLLQYVLKTPRSLPHAQFKLMLPVALMSMVLNNTPVVAMFIPTVQDWAKRHDLSVSRLMLPLSYAAIAGGTCTLIGTSTNLVVHGLLLEESRIRLDLFEPAWLGLPVSLVVFLYVLWLGNRWLPDRRAALQQFSDARQYTVEMRLPEGSPLAGKTIEEAGLRQLPGMYLMEIERGEHILPAVSSRDFLRAGDRLVFAGIVDSVVDLQKIRGLAPATNQVFKLNSPRPERCLIEAVVSDSCPLLGKTVREGRFRAHYQAAVIAVSRNGERLNRKLGDIVLRAGDTLLLEAHPSFLEQHRHSRDFFLISALNDSRPPRHERGGIALTILVGMVGSVALEWLSMLEAAMLAAGLMILTRCTSPQQARQAVDWQVLIVIAASFGLSAALAKTGAANGVAEFLIGFSGGSPWLALALVYLSTALFTALITNNAAAVIMFPIAFSSAGQLGVSFLPFALIIMVAASASFATPIGYQTNLMVYGPGGYRFGDYIRFGLPLTLLVGLLVVALAPLIWPLNG